MKHKNMGIRYGVGEIGTAVFEFMLAHILYYLTTVQFMDSGQAGIITGIGSVIGGIVCATVGGIVDNVHIRGGSKRGFMIGTYSLVFILLIIIFSPIDLGGYKFVVYLILYALFIAAYESFFVPFEALGGVVIQDYDERTRSRMICTVVNYIGVLFADTISFYIKNAMVAAGLSEKISWALTTILLACICCSGVIISWRATKGAEPEVVRDSGNKKKTNVLAIFQEYGRLLRVKPVRQIASISFVGGMSTLINTTMLLYFGVYVAKVSETVSATLYAVVVVASILSSITIVPVINKKFGKKFLPVAADAVYIIYAVYVLISGRTTLTEAILMSVAIGIMTGISYSGVISMAYDINEVVEYKHGEAKPSEVMGVYSLISVVGSAIMSFAIGRYLSWAGFDGSLAVQSDRTIYLIVIITTLIPIILDALHIIIVLGWKITNERHDALIEAIAARKEGRPYSDEKFRDLL